MRLARETAFSCALPALLLSASACAGLNGVNVTISNDGTEDVMVTVYDMSTRPASVVLSAERINGFTRIPISLAPDASGRGNLAWTAVSVDPRSRKCGHAASEGVSDSASIRVRADTECGRT